MRHPHLRQHAQRPEGVPARAPGAALGRPPPNDARWRPAHAQWHAGRLAALTRDGTQVFPYFYVRCGDLLLKHPAGVADFVESFRVALDALLARRSTQQAAQGDGVQAGSAAGAAGAQQAEPRSRATTQPRVFSCTLVKAACFYGYNPDEEPFLRVCLCVRGSAWKGWG